jgi:hypothetical protein
MTMAPVLTTQGQTTPFNDESARAVAPYIDPGRASLVTLDWTSTNAPWTRTLALGDQSVVLDMQPRSVRSENFKLMASVAPGVEVEVPAPAPATYWGTVRDMPGGLAAISFVAGKAQGLITFKNGEGWYIQPASDLITNAPADQYLVYPANAVVRRGGRCGVTAEEMAEAALAAAGTPPAVGPGTCNRLCQIGIDADFEFFTDNGLSVANSQAAIDASMNAVQLIYNRDVNVVFQVIGTVIRTSNVIYNDTTDANVLLGRFRTEWNTNQTARVPRDVAHLYTGKDTGMILGLASVNALCGNNAYGFSQNRRASPLADRIATTAHELGHNFSASHCDDDPDCSIMCSAVNSCASTAAKFSSRSATQIRQGAQSTCLSPTGGVTTPLPPAANNDFFVVLANNIITAFDPLGNDGDGNCNPLTLVSFTPTGSGGGTLTRSVGTGPGGRDRVIYTSPSTPVRTDVFTYTVSDGFTSVDATIFVDNQRSVPASTTTNPRPKLDVAFYNLATNVTSMPNFANLPPFKRSSVDLINIPIRNQIVPPSTAPTTNILDSGINTRLGVVFAGFFDMPYNGIMRFSLDSTNGSKLYIDDLLIVDNDGVHNARERTGLAYLQAGLHPIRVEYFHTTGDWSLALSAESVNNTLYPKQIIQPAQFFRRGCVADVATVGGGAGGDNLITNDDIILFLREFFAGNVLVADVASVGGNATPDGNITADDMIVYLNSFFIGCAF